MTNQQPKLAIVIHTEEEFDWDGGFYRSNDSVSHGEELKIFVDKILGIHGKVVFALDYAFVKSDEGRDVIKHYIPRLGRDIEFAAHVHPWVNPPFDRLTDAVDDINSYPGNLAAADERAKIEMLTNTIQKQTGYRPVTYLAGRYGIGENTNKILASLNYTTDLSISPYANFTHQQGPDFSEYTNRVFKENGICYWPHTTGIVSSLQILSRFLNLHPRFYAKISENLFFRLFAKVFGVQRLRLSPEGFSLSHMKTVTKTLLAQGQSDFIFSFHSPSVKPGCTPYVGSVNEKEMFEKKVMSYLDWFRTELKGRFVLIDEKLSS